MRRVDCVTVLILACLTPALATAADEIGRESLKGLRAVHVVIERMSPEAERDGLPRDTIQTDVELKLRQAGITVSSKSEPPAFAYIYVNVNTLKAAPPTSGLYAYCVHVELVQGVTLARNAKVLTYAPTWRALGSVGTVVAVKLSRVREVVRDAVDEFINDYLAVNPK